jgi:hypothetical protein
LQVYPLQEFAFHITRFASFEPSPSHPTLLHKLAYWVWRFFCFEQLLLQGRHHKIMTSQGKKKYKGGNVFRYEPQGMTLVNSNPTYRVSFEQLDVWDSMKTFRGIMCN